VDIRIYVVWLSKRNTLHPQEGCCIGVFCSSMELNMVAPAVHPAFYSSRPGGYTVTQGLTGGPRVEKTLCHI
jgi:hypothetical protein